MNRSFEMEIIEGEGQSVEIVGNSDGTVRVELTLPALPKNGRIAIRFPPGVHSQGCAGNHDFETRQDITSIGFSNPGVLEEIPETEVR